MRPEIRADLLRAVTDFYEVVRRRLDEAECDQSEWEAIFDYLQALSEASAELMRKLNPSGRSTDGRLDTDWGHLLPLKLPRNLMFQII
jgi:hypothetical protein